MKIPKHVILHDAPESLWGVARLRQPVLIVEMHRAAEDAISTTYQPYVWPPDAQALTTEAKLNKAMTALWHCFGSYADDAGEVRMYAIDLLRPLPRFLVADNDESDFTAVIDTEHGLLWSISADCRSLILCDWQMHPSIRAALTEAQPAATLAREAGDYWFDFIRQQNILDP